MDIKCTFDEAFGLLKAFDEDFTFILTKNNVADNIKQRNEKVKRKEVIKLLREAKEITYQNNDFFGRISIYGILENIVYNILFPQSL